MTVDQASRNYFEGRNNKKGKRKGHIEIKEEPKSGTLHQTLFKPLPVAIWRHGKVLRVCLY
jgi:hypothetical protein